MALIDLNITEGGDLVAGYDILNYIEGDARTTLYNKLNGIINKLFLYKGDVSNKFSGVKITATLDTEIEQYILDKIKTEYPYDVEAAFIKVYCAFKSNDAYLIFTYIDIDLEEKLLKRINMII